MNTGIITYQASNYDSYQKLLLTLIALDLVDIITNRQGLLITVQYNLDEVDPSIYVEDLQEIVTVENSKTEVAEKFIGLSDRIKEKDNIIKDITTALETERKDKNTYKDWALELNRTNQRVKEQVQSIAVLLNSICLSK